MLYRGLEQNDELAWVSFPAPFQHAEVEYKPSPARVFCNTRRYSSASYSDEARTCVVRQEGSGGWGQESPNYNRSQSSRAASAKGGTGVTVVEKMQHLCK